MGAFWRGRTSFTHRRYHRRMTDDLFRADAYLRACEARILRIDDSGIVLDRTVAATGISPVVDDPILYVRVGTASGVAGSGIDVVVVIEPLP